MKKVFVVALLVIMLIAAGCGEKTVEPTETSQSQTESLEETVEIPEELPKESDEPTDEEKSFDNEVLIFELKTDGEAYCVIGIAAGEYKTVEIPSEHEGKPVTEILKEAFVSAKIEKVIIPETVIKIGERAFDGTRLSQAEFKDVQGWAAGDKFLPTTILENEKNAATYLRQTFAQYEWNKK